MKTRLCRVSTSCPWETRWPFHPSSALVRSNGSEGDVARESSLSEVHLINDVADGLATITLNRPERHNAISPEVTGRRLASFDMRISINGTSVVGPADLDVLIDHAGRRRRMGSTRGGSHRRV